ncbi:hypothetical protein ACKFKG_33175 [Phormidesmis sp. 146-35]
MTALQDPINPFPGLRPFTEQDQWFYGREVQVDQLLTQLETHRFLAVLGASGSGKSSLIKAGVIRTLIERNTTAVNRTWRIAQFRPGNFPIAELAKALNVSLGRGQTTQESVRVFETSLRIGDLGLIELVKLTLPEQSNLLILVDQFEELFRYRNSSQGNAIDESAAFVKLLIAAARSNHVAIYIMLTMRSDYIGDCSQFRDLAEFINSGLYLVPRMTREQLRRAICEPILACGASISNALVNRLLNDVSDGMGGSDNTDKLPILQDNTDKLPILQHILMRIWSIWSQENPRSDRIELQHYKAAGGFNAALSDHADHIYATLPSNRHRKIAEIMFKRLTEAVDGQDGIRQLTPLEEICAVANASEEQVRQVVEAFRALDCSFLTPLPPSPLTAQTTLDISHESLMRCWKRCKKWVQQEKDLAEKYLELAKFTELHNENNKSLLRDPELKTALQWYERNESTLTTAWAQRYQPKHYKTGIKDTKAFIQRSKGRQKIFWITCIVAGAVAAGVGLYALAQGQVRDLERRISFNTALQNSDQQLDALVDSIRLGQAQNEQWLLWLLKFFRTKLFGEQTDLTLMATLSQAVYNTREINRLEEHTDWVSTVEVSPDQKMLASASRDNTIRLWKPDGERGKVLRSHTEWVNRISISPNNQRLASASDDRTVKVWKINTNQAKAQSEDQPISLKHSTEVLSVSFSPNSQIIASGGKDGKIRVWNTETGQLLDNKQADSDGVYSLRFTQTGQLASGGSDGVIRLWTIDTKTAKFRDNSLVFSQKHTGTIREIDFSRDGKLLASASEDSTIRIWQLDGKQLAQLKRQSDSGEESGHVSGVYGVKFSPDNQWLASASADKTIKLWKTEDFSRTAPEPVLTLKGHYDTVRSVGFINNQTLVSASFDRTVRIWDIAEQSLPTPITDIPQIRRIRFSPDHRFIAAMSISKIKYWDETVQKSQELSLPTNNNSEFTDISFSQDSKKLAAAIYTSNQTGLIAVWALGDRTPKILDSQPGRINSLFFSRDGTSIIAVSDDGTIKSINNQHSSTIPSPVNTEFSIASIDPESNRLAIAGRAINQEQYLVFLQTDEKQRWRKLCGGSSRIEDLAFSSDGKHLTAATNDREVRTWSIDKPPDAAPCESHESAFQTQEQTKSVSFGTTSKLLVSLSDRGKIRLSIKESEPQKWDTKIIQRYFALDFQALDESGTVKVSTDGKSIASVAGVSNSSVVLWSLEIDRLLAQGCRKLNNYLKHSKQDKHLCDRYPVSHDLKPTSKRSRQ